MQRFLGQGGGGGRLLVPTAPGRQPNRHKPGCRPDKLGVGQGLLPALQKGQRFFFEGLELETPPLVLFLASAQVWLGVPGQIGRVQGPPQGNL